MLHSLLCTQFSLVTLEECVSLRIRTSSGHKRLKSKYSSYECETDHLWHIIYSYSHHFCSPISGFVNKLNLDLIQNIFMRAVYLSVVMFV